MEILCIPSSEEIRYPAFRKAGGKEQDIMYHEAKEEHRTVDALVLPDLKQTEPSTTEFSGRVKVVKGTRAPHRRRSKMFLVESFSGKAIMTSWGWKWKR